MPIQTIKSRLNEFSIFGGIEAESLLELSDLFKAGFYPAGSLLIEEGERGIRLFVITRGSVEVTKGIESAGRSPAHRLQLATLKSGDSFGEMEILDTQQRSATVTAREETETIELTNIALLRIFERDPTCFRMLIMNIARDLSRRLRAADDQLATLTAAQLASSPPGEH